MFTVIHVDLLSLDILAQDQESPHSNNQFKDTLTILFFGSGD